MNDEQVTLIYKVLQEIAIGVSMLETDGSIDDVASRDDFAIAALNGLLAGNDHDLYKKEYAKLAYEYADAMMDARDE